MPTTLLRPDSTAFGERYWLPILIMLALLVRIGDLQGLGLGVMEIDQLNMGLYLCPRLWECIANTGAVHHGPVTPLILRLVYYLGLNSDAAIRLTAVAFGAGGVWLTYRFAEAGFGISVARWAGLLVAIAPWHVQYSRNIRPYALHYLLVTAVLYLCWRRLTAPERWHGYTIALLTIVALFNHLMAGPILAGAVFALPFYRGKYQTARSTILWLLGGFAAASPYLLYMVSMGNDDPDLQLGLWNWYIGHLAEVAGPLTGIVGPAGLALLVALIAWVLHRGASAKTRLREKIFARGTPNLLLLLCWLAPLVIISAVSLLWLPVNRVEYLLPCLASAAILLAEVLVALPKYWRAAGMAGIWGGSWLMTAVVVIIGHGALPFNLPALDRRIGASIGEKPMVQSVLGDLARTGIMNVTLLAWPPYFVSSFIYYRDRLPPNVSLPQSIPDDAVFTLPDRFCLVTFVRAANMPGIAAMSVALRQNLDLYYRPLMPPLKKRDYHLECMSRVRAGPPVTFHYLGG